MSLKDLEFLISIWLLACWTMKFDTMCQVENAETWNPKLSKKGLKNFYFTEHFTFLTISTEWGFLGMPRLLNKCKPSACLLA